MASAYKCDKCGKLYEDSSIESMPRVEVRIVKSGPVIKYLDFCPDCKRVLETWIGCGEYERKEWK